MKILFSYKCAGCNHEEEVYIERNDTSPVKCSLCGSDSFRQITTSAFTFKEGHGKGTSGGHTMRFTTPTRK